MSDNFSGHFKHMRYPDVPDPRVPRSIGRIYRDGTPFLTEYQGKIDNLVADLRDKFDQPYDELYHKEKILIQNVIEAEAALKKKMDSLPSPLHNRYQSPV